MRAALVAVLTVFVLILALFRQWGARHDGHEAPAQPCTQGSHDDRERAEQTIELLASTSTGSDLLEGLEEPPRICFSEHGSQGIVSNGPFLLDGDATDTSNAAFLGHLLAQAAYTWEPTLENLDRVANCHALVDKIIGVEVHAHTRELELRRELGVTDEGRALPFERSYWELPAPQRSRFLFDYFWGHPQGDTGWPGLVAAYTQRCEDL